MIKILSRAVVKAKTALIAAQCRLRSFFAGAKKTALNCEGQGTLDVAVFCVED